MTVPLPSFHRAVLALLLALAGLGFATSSAGAVVTYVDRSCVVRANAVGIPPYTMSIPSPAGTVAGDFLVLTVRDALTAPNNPNGWTSLLSSGNMESWYRVATNSGQDDVTINMFTGPDTGVGVMARFTGVDNANPFAGVGAQSTGSSNSAALPDGTGTRPGSMRYSAVGTGAVTFTFTGMTEICDTSGGSVLGGGGIGAAVEATGVGPTASRSAGMSASGAWIAQTYVLQPPSSCGTGGLNFTAPGAVVFPATSLNGLDQTLTTSTPMTVDDQTASENGWNVSATSTTFTSGAFTLPTNAVRVTGVTPTAGTGRCSAPTNAVTYPVTLPAAAVAPAANKIFNAAVGTGSGATNLLVGLDMFLPARTHVGLYSSTWTLTLSTGP